MSLKLSVSRSRQSFEGSWGSHLKLPFILNINHCIQYVVVFSVVDTGYSLLIPGLP